MGKKLSDDQIAQYRRDGFVFSVDCFRRANAEETLRYEEIAG
jgi:hypothetical protein